MRKLISVCALVLALGIATPSKPVEAIAVCDCDFCSWSPNSWCEDGEHGGLRYRCYEYTWFYCS